jgi:integrative and conjugative element protein (TIGR02256 family)
MSESLKIVFISNSLVDRILAEANRKFPCETGGILMGYSSSGGECFVTDLVGPGPNARHARMSFDPDYEFQKEQVASVYRESQRLHSYMGDWHTHPQGSYELSSTDRAALKQIAASRQARCAAPLMLLAVGGPKWELRLWRWTGNAKNSAQTVDLQII